MRVDVPDVSPNGKIDRSRLKLSRRGRPADSARILLAGVLGNCPLLLDWATGEHLAYAPRERGDVGGIVHLTPFNRTLPSQSTSLGVGQAFLFGSLERGFFDEHTLTLVAPAGTAEAHNHSMQRRVPFGAASQRGVSTLEENEMIEIGTPQAKRPFPLHAKKAPLPKFLGAFRAG